MTHPNGDLELRSYMTRRSALERSLRIGAGLTVAGSMSAFLAACGQGGEETATVPAGVTAKPGTDIPKKQIDFAMSPFADDSIAVIAMTNGYFKDNGIEIGPTPTGGKQNLTESVAPLLSGQVDAGSAVFEVVLSQLDKVQAVKSFIIHGTFQGYAMFAPKDTDAKSLKEFMAEGQPFKEALASTMSQFKGKKVALSNDPAIQLFYKLIFDESGVKRSDLDASALDNPAIVTAAQAGKVDLASPSGGPQVVQLTKAGLKEILNQGEIMDGSRDARSLTLVGHSSYVTNTKHYNEDYETVLRMAAAIYRAMDLIRNDPAAAAKAELPYLNSASGADLTAEDLKILQTKVGKEATFDEVANFYKGPSAVNVNASGKAQIAAYRKAKVLREPHEVSELEGSQKVYEDLLAYKQQADVLFKDNEQSEDVVKQAKAHYDARNYLDAYRFLAS